MKRPRTAPRTEPRRWRTPPPITRTADALEGMEVLREVPGEAGVLLWQTYRNVMFWASIPASERKELFTPGAGDNRKREIKAAELPRDLVQPLRDLAEILSAPETVQPESVGGACRAIADWATEHEHQATALAFAQAAALAASRDAAASFAVGRMARLQGDHARADTWYRHAVMLARQVGDWESYVRSYNGLGKIFIHRGNLPMAHRMLIKGLRAARRKGLGELQGMVLHDLFVVATQSGRNESALEFARGSFRHYGAEHPDIRRLTHDVAYVWLEQGHFARAAAVFKALAPAAEEADLSVLAYSNLARAAGNLGDVDQFQRAWTEAMRRIRMHPKGQTTADCLLELGMGAAALGEWERATEALERSATEARELGVNAVRMRAESVLEALRAEKKVEAKPAVPGSPEQERTADLLADRMVRTLTSQRNLARR
jgi:tetratricopeptide (TPR) repeat protein